MVPLRRFFFALLVLGIAMLVFGIVRSSRPGYGLLDLAGGKPPPEEKFTEATGPKLSASDVSVLAQLDDEFAKVSAAVLPSVVRINTKAVVQKYVQFGMFAFPSQGVDEGVGSGAFVSKEGHIVTNYHVIKGAQEVTVIANDRRSYKARVIGVAENLDVALIKVESDRTDFPALKFADSDKVRVGQIVFAVGNPFGLTGTVTQGIISARDRVVSDTSNDYLQTDTVINPGNSGGPLVNIRGEIVGVNVSIYQGTKGVNSWQGVGFAIPGNEAKQAVEAIRKLGANQPAKKGVGSIGLQMVTVPGIDGVVAGYVYPGSPAEEAGLQYGDVILEFNGRRVVTADQLRDAIVSTPPGSPFKMKVVRGREVGVVNGTVGSPEQTRQ